MRDIHEVVREKEAQLTQINEELTALRVALRLLTEDATDRALPNDGQKLPPMREEPPKQPGRVKNFP